MEKAQQRKIQHLLWRAGFGPTIQDMKEYGEMQSDKVVDLLFFKSANPNKISISPDFDVKAIHRKGLTSEELRVLRNESLNGLKKLNLKWLLSMADSEKQLLEKMTLFWHGHFSCVNFSYLHVESYLNTLRTHALGNFGTLLRAISKEPAMLTFLNNRQNRKQSPNENFARELLELFSLGIGNYSENDIKEAARAFTGWTNDEYGSFEVQDRFHDYDEKSFMGKTGKFSGDDIIDMVLENPQTAKFIVSKIYKFIVDENPDRTRVDHLANVFFNSSYDIPTLLKEIFKSDWFYEEKIIGNRIKSPIELLVSFTRKFDIDYEDPAPLLYIQRLLGQVLLKPPNVAGWNYGRTWIDSSSLLARMQFAKFIVSGASINIQAKKNDVQEMDQVMAQMENINENRFRKVKARLNIKDYMNAFKNMGADEMTRNIEQYLLQCDPSAGASEILKKLKNSSDNLIEDYSLHVLSLPEYQLC